MNNYRFGNYLCDLREKKNLSQKQLGLQLGISNKTISKWENGGGYPSAELVMPLAKALGVSVEELYAAMANDKKEKSKLRKMIDVIVNKSALIVGILLGVHVIQLVLFLAFGISEDKVRLFLITVLISAVVYAIFRFVFRFIVKNPIVPSKYIDFMFIFMTTVFCMGAIMLLVEYITQFPNGYSPTPAIMIAAFAAFTQSLKKRI